MLSFHQVVAGDFAAVNKRIIHQLHSDVPLVEDIGHYLVEAGGKRLRPLMVLLSANALGYSERGHIDLAVIIEFIHTATLLHDDVVDTSELRRGRPTANAQWGNAPSVLVGDFLYSRAFQMMVALEQMDIMSVLSTTTNLIAEGEVEQLVNAKDPSVSEEQYFSVIGKKTAVLFASACEAAALLSGASDNERQSLKAYGQQVGMAFQLVDDALDYQGNAQELGKNLGDDLAEGKPTLPLIHAMRHSDATSARLIANAIQTGDVSQLDKVMAIVKAHGSMTHTLERAQQAVQSALKQLQHLPDNAYTRAMRELALFALERQY